MDTLNTLGLSHTLPDHQLTIEVLLQTRNIVDQHVEMQGIDIVSSVNWNPHNEGKLAM